MKFSQFIDVFVAALYNETQIGGRRGFRIHEILDKYGLELTPTWADALFKDYTFTSRVDARRHLGRFVDQQVEISPEGIRWVEDELGENVAEFLERNGAASPPVTQSVPPQLDDAVSGSTADEVKLTYHPPVGGVDSSRWTGIEERLARDPAKVEEIRSKIREIDVLLSKAGLNNHEMAKARAVSEALVKLVESPEPEWKAIVDLLQSPALGAALNIVGLIHLVAGFILSAS